MCSRRSPGGIPLLNFSARKFQLSPEAHVPEMRDGGIERLARFRLPTLITVESAERRVGSREIEAIAMVCENIDTAQEVLRGFHRLLPSLGDQAIHAIG